MRNLKQYNLEWFYNYFIQNGGKIDSVQSFQNVFNFINLNDILDSLDHKFELTVIYDKNNNLINITIPNSVQSIGDYAFTNNPINLAIFEGDYVTFGGNNIFLGSNLTEINVFYQTLNWPSIWSSLNVNIIDQIRSLEKSVS